MTECSKKTISYIGLLFVVLVWGCVPLITLHHYKFYSPTIRVCFTELVLLITYLIIARKHVKEFNLEYIKVGVPTGLFLALANISQKIGLLYTTPARYAFLENLSCITVPILMYILVKKRPGISAWLASLVCLASAFVLNGISFSDSAWGVGEILCAVSGLLYGFNIAGTGVFAKKLNTPLYLATQSTVGFSTSLIFSVVLNFVTITNDSGISQPIEKIMFSFNPMHVIYVVLVAVITSAFCWIIRTNSMKHIDACVVAVITPFSAVITSIISVMLGKDQLDLNLILGSILGLLSIFLSSADDIFKIHLQKKSNAKLKV